MVICDTDIP